MTLGQRIQELRKGLGLSQEELGERVGVSRQAISKWEGDLTIPELDNLIALSKLFGLTVGQLLGVEQPVPAPAASRITRRQVFFLSGMAAAILILAVLVGVLWFQVRPLTRRLSANDVVYSACYGRDLFQIAECSLSDISLGFLKAQGEQDLTLEFTLRPVKQLKGWTVIGLTADINGQNPAWWLDPKGQPQDSAAWSRTEEMAASTARGVSRASLSLPNYGGESVSVRATLREKETGLTIETSEVFSITAETDASGAVTAIQTLENTAPDAFLPRSVFLALPDPRFET